MKQRRTKSELAIPILRGTHAGRTISLYCPYCNAIHVHGYAAGDGLTHRVAHCTNPLSPLHRTGYFIAPWRVKDAAAAIERGQP